jgi:hypothetical protein
MSDPVKICNQALLLLGEKRIQALDEDTPEGEVCDTFYIDARDHVLRELKPSFARKRVTLTSAGAKPEWGFDHAWRLPQDYVVVTMLDNQTLQDRQYRDWRVEGKDFLTDRSEPHIQYVHNTDVEALADSSFVKALAAYLAYEIAYPLTNSNDKVSAMFALYENRRDDAMATYGQESSTVKTTNDQLTIVR